jgi:outer membrane immunogenic protein
MRILISFLSLLISVNAIAASSSTAKKLDTLGGNQALVNMATSMDPENRARIVQKRLVDRNNTFELGLNYGSVLGGDSYMKTQAIGAGLEFHINPRWSLGVRYFDYGNSLTPEGRQVFERAQEAYNKGGKSYSIPDIDYPLNSTMGVLSWYPIYGKTNLLDWGIAQFDIYLMAGAGQMQLSSGESFTAMGGAGVGFWMTKHLSARAELRYQNYKDSVVSSAGREINAFSGSFGIGLLL